MLHTTEDVFEATFSYGTLTNTLQDAKLLSKLIESHIYSKAIAYAPYKMLQPMRTTTLLPLTLAKLINIM